MLENSSSIPQQTTTPNQRRATFRGSCLILLVAFIGLITTLFWIGKDQLLIQTHLYFANYKANNIVAEASAFNNDKMPKRSHVLLLQQAASNNKALLKVEVLNVVDWKVQSHHLDLVEVPVVNQRIQCVKQLSPEKTKSGFAVTIVLKPSLKIVKKESRKTINKLRLRYSFPDPKAHLQNISFDGMSFE